MANAKRDGNRVPTLIAVSSVDSLTPVVLEADAVLKALNINIVGDDVGIGGGTSYTEDAAKSGNATGGPIMAERDDIIATVTPVAGDWIPIRGSAEGALWTQDFNSDAILADTTVVAGAVAAGQMQVDIVADGAGLATSAAQLADGHNVTVDNAAAGAAVNIQDGGNTITVDGTVTAELSAVDNAVLDNIALYTQGSEIALEKIDGAIVGPGEPTIDSYTQLAINLNAAADQVLVASAADKQIWVYGITYTCSVAGTVSFQDEDNTAITGIMDHAANSGLSHPTSGNFAMPIWKLATNKDLEVDVVTCAIDGWLDYAIVSV